MKNEREKSDSSIVAKRPRTNRKSKRSILGLRGGVGWSQWKGPMLCGGGHLEHVQARHRVLPRVHARGCIRLRVGRHDCAAGEGGQGVRRTEAARTIAGYVFGTGTRQRTRPRRRVRVVPRKRSGEGTGRSAAARLGAFRCRLLLNGLDVLRVGQVDRAPLRLRSKFPCSTLRARLLGSIHGRRFTSTLTAS